MGPAGLSDSVNTNCIPLISREAEKVSWREEVRELAQNVTACATAGDNRVKGIAATLAHTLYRSLSSDKKYILKRALPSGEIFLTPSDDISKSNQIELVEKLMQIGANDTQIESIRRI